MSSSYDQIEDRIQKAVDHLRKILMRNEPKLGVSLTYRINDFVFGFKAPPRIRSTRTACKTSIT